LSFECPKNGGISGALFVPEGMPQIQNLLNKPKAEMAQIALDAPSTCEITD